MSFKVARIACIRAVSAWLNAKPFCDCIHIRLSGPYIESKFTILILYCTQNAFTTTDMRPPTCTGLKNGSNWSWGKHNSFLPCAPVQYLIADNEFQAHKLHQSTSSSNMAVLNSTSFLVMPSCETASRNNIPFCKLRRPDNHYSTIVSETLWGIWQVPHMWRQQFQEDCTDWPPLICRRTFLYTVHIRLKCTILGMSAQDNLINISQYQATGSQLII